MPDLDKLLVIIQSPEPDSCQKLEGEKFSQQEEQQLPVEVYRRKTVFIFSN